jgi:hypothetical protein
VDAVRRVGTNGCDRWLLPTICTETASQAAPFLEHAATPSDVHRDCRVGADNTDKVKALGMLVRLQDAQGSAHKCAVSLVCGERVQQQISMRSKARTTACTGQIKPMWRAHVQDIRASTCLEAIQATASASCTSWHERIMLPDHRYSRLVRACAMCERMCNSVPSS